MEGRHPGCPPKGFVFTRGILKAGKLLQDNSESITFKHSMAERTRLSDCSVDLVSACLIFHEVPSASIEQILEEAFRILRPGGTLGIMVRTLMNPLTSLQ